MPLSEAETGSFLHQYLSVQFDPVHLLSELGFTVVFDFLLLFVLWGKIIKPYLNRRMNQLHQQLDAEHHVEHHNHDQHAREEMADQ